MSLHEQKSAVSESILRTLAQHGIHDWGVRFTRAYNTLGSASFRTKTVNISSLQFAKGWDVTRDTAMHEAAHVIAGPEANHGPEWKRVAASLGAKTNARHNVDIKRDARARSVSTRYGSVDVVEGKTVVQYKDRPHVVSEIRTSKLVIDDASGRRVLVPADMAHPNYGDLSKMTNGATKRMALDDGDYVTATEGKTTFDVGDRQFTVTEVRKKNFIATDGSGRSFVFSASRLDPMEAKLEAAWARAKASNAARRR